MPSNNYLGVPMFEIRTPNNQYDHPISTVEKDNKKYLQYELIGLNETHLKVQKKFINKSRELFITVKGEFKDEVTGWENEIKIELEVDWEEYNKVTWSVKDGILTIVLHEVINKEPEVDLQRDYGFGELDQVLDSF